MIIVMHLPHRSQRANSQRGFTFLWLIFSLAVVASALAAIAQPIQLAAQREREAELRFRGSQIGRALSSYRERTPRGTKQLPLTLEDLVEDRRSEPPLHHLRQLYTDPFTGQADWVLLKDEEGHITAVRSRSSQPAARVVDLPRGADGEATSESARVFAFESGASTGSASAPETSPSATRQSAVSPGAAQSP